ncbi:hypothetical protein CTI12_AA472590 [Artemisia annua]|uniref:Helicase XPB/Ssl2 N-terminal domain-containing protein n=1 Tax=Artemisia annua TaxID=35608 RepID=A0A2U1LMP5_ARTAN|nr:hypothetical protein CTI12_AA472590 [Artemisia annua]
MEHETSRRRPNKRQKLSYYGEDDRKLELKADHINRPLWACADGRIFLETFSPFYKEASDFLTAIAEPLCRPESLHEYNLTPHSLYAAVSVGLETETIIAVLNKLAKTKLPKKMVDFIHASTANYGKVNYPLLEEYDFENDTVNPDLEMKLKPQAQLRPHQEKSLSRMFGNADPNLGLASVEPGSGGQADEGGPVVQPDGSSA